MTAFHFLLIILVVVGLVVLLIAYRLRQRPAVACVTLLSPLLVLILIGTLNYIRSDQLINEHQDDSNRFELRHVSFHRWLGPSEDGYLVLRIVSRKHGLSRNHYLLSGYMRLKDAKMVVSPIGNERYNVSVSASSDRWEVDCLDGISVRKMGKS